MFLRSINYFIKTTIKILNLNPVAVHIITNYIYI